MYMYSLQFQIKLVIFVEVIRLTAYSDVLLSTAWSAVTWQLSEG